MKLPFMNIFVGYALFVIVYATWVGVSRETRKQTNRGRQTTSLAETVTVVDSVSTTGNESVPKITINDTIKFFSS